MRVDVVAIYSPYLERMIDWLNVRSTYRKSKLPSINKAQGLTKLTLDTSPLGDNP